MIIVTSTGLFGPFGRCEQLADRVRTWPVGAADDAPGADLPYSVIGIAQVLDIETPPGFSPDGYDWDGEGLVPHASASADAPIDDQ